MASRPDYYDRVNSALLNRIPCASESVLEIGCGTGALGKAYKRRNPNVTYVGVEVEKEAAKKAKHALDDVFICDVEQNNLNTILNSSDRYDCIVFGDVLEHLRDPQKLITGLLPYLKKDGVILACIPNVQHWSVISSLIKGEWPQEDSGLFDKTHLRWFTKESIINMMDNIGLNIYEITSIIRDEDNARNFAKNLLPALKQLNIDPNKLLNGVAPYQYIVRAGKIQQKRLSITGLMMKPQAGMNDIRMINPLRSVGSYPGVSISLSSDVVHLHPSSHDLPKIMIWQRQLLKYSDDSIERIKKVINAGYILISEFDDDPDHWPEISMNSYLNFSGVHAVQVSTKLLKEKIIGYNSEVKSFDNCLEELPDLSDDKWLDIDNKIRIFFGALNRKESWEKWIDSINEVIGEEPSIWEFEVIHDHEFYSRLMTVNKNYTPTCSYEEYLNLLKSCHAALLPLENTSFNRYKSDLKFVECAGCNVAPIASPTVYESAIKNNATGIIIQDPKEIISLLKRWKDNRHEIRAIANKSMEWCKKYRLQSYQSKARIDWYQSLWERRDELTESLLKRVPELKN